MASATFGRKGLSADAAPQQAPQRRQFGQAAPAAAEAADPMAERRAAFIAAERARAADADGARQAEGREAAARPTMPAGGRSLATAYILWFFLGSFSAHRFYLRTPLTAIAQVCLWYISLMFFMAGTPQAFYTLALGWLWIIGDALVIPQMRNAANEKARRRAEALTPEPAEAVSS